MVPFSFVWLGTALALTIRSPRQAEGAHTSTRIYTFTNVYNKNSNYATMRFEPESLHGANNGLNIARNLMEKVKQEFPWISYGDLWTLAGVCAIQVRNSSVRNNPSLIYGRIIRKCKAPRFLGDPVALMVSPKMRHLTVAYQMPLKVLTTSDM